MVSTRLTPIEISCSYENERAKQLSSFGIDKIKSFPALVGFALGGVFIIIHWSVQQVFLVPKKVMSLFSK